jgi:hypothetical protein
MATKAEELRIMAQEIKNETQVGANTAERVGTAFEQAANGLAELSQNVGDINLYNAIPLGFFDNPSEAIARIPLPLRKGGMTLIYRDSNGVQL